VSFDLKSKDVNITADSGVNVMDIVHAIQAKKYKVGIKE
jgi:mercuric transport protein periplasmic component